MKSRQEIQSILRAYLPELRRRFHVQRIGLFGSWARGEQTPESDVDILVSLSQPLGLELVDLHEYLKQLLGVEVDLVTEGAVTRKPLLWQFIQQDLIYIEAAAQQTRRGYEPS